MEKSIKQIYSVIKNNNEDIIFHFIIKDYVGLSFFIALVFNKTIEKFKVLYVPLNIVKRLEIIDEYFCYQFISASRVNTLLGVFNDIQEDNKQDIGIMYEMNNCHHYLEFVTYKPLEKRVYKFIQYIDSSYELFFTLITTLMEYLPNSMDEILRKIIEEFNTYFEVFKYNESVNFQLYSDEISKIIDSSNFTYKDRKVEFLERIGEKYYAVVDSKRFLLDTNHDILNIYSGKENPFGEEVFLIIKAIREKITIPFYKIKYIEDNHDYSLFCYGVDFDNEEFLIFNRLKDKKVTLKDLVNDKIRIYYIDKELKDKIITYLKSKYVAKKAEKIINFTFINNDQ